MKAISFPASRQVEIIDIPSPQPGPEEVLVKVRYIGLCGTDLNIYRGSMQLASYPRVPGHEVSGIIVELFEGQRPIAQVHEIDVARVHIRTRLVQRDRNV